MLRPISTLLLFAALTCGADALPAADVPLRVGVFAVDVTPAIGSPVAYAPAREILDPLSARGVVLLTADKPIVLCAVDWIGIANSGHDAWREELATAAGTTPDRVTVHALHQHDGPQCDFDAEALLAERGLAGKAYDVPFLRRAISSAAAGVKKGIAQAQPVTHVGFGKAKVEKVASNRRLLGPDGRVQIMRFSKSTIPAAIAAPEGVIDPYLQTVCFFQEERPLVVLTYYATHPQSYYGKGDVTAEFVGLARAAREEALPGTPHIHFNGASGNVAAGKYNDGSTAMRPILAARMEDGMRRSWESVKRQPISSADVAWRTREVHLPPGKHLEEKPLLELLDDPKAEFPDRLRAARHLAFARRMQARRPILLSCLTLGPARLLHMPGELFIEYQLAAQAMQPDRPVMMAAYADYGPGYIGTAIAYTQGGYETSERASRVALQVEQVLTEGLRDLLK